MHSWCKHLDYRGYYVYISWNLFALSQGIQFFLGGDGICGSYARNAFDSACFANASEARKAAGVKGVSIELSEEFVQVNEAAIDILRL